MPPKVYNRSVYSDELKAIFTEAEAHYLAGATVQHRRNIPTLEADIPKDGNHWLRIDDVLCIFIDMKNSTRLSATHNDKGTANVYEYFTDTAVRVLDHFDASYIDVRGDGAFGIFDKAKFYQGMAAAVTFLTFATSDLKRVAKIDGKSITCHVGADIKPVLLKRIGLRSFAGQTDRQNEVWAGKPVNMASKLASRGEDNDFLISERVHAQIVKDKCEGLLLTCGCKAGTISPEGKTPAWQAHDIPEGDNQNLDFKKYYRIIPRSWCATHGASTMNSVLRHSVS